MNAVSDLCGSLGIKTEGHGPLIQTSSSGRTEVLGGLLYPVHLVRGGRHHGRLQQQRGACESLVNGTSAYNPNSNVPVQVSETRGGVTKTLPSPAGMGRIAMPLFVGCPAADFPAMGTGGSGGSAPLGDAGASGGASGSGTAGGSGEATHTPAGSAGACRCDLEGSAPASTPALLGILCSAAVWRRRSLRRRPPFRWWPPPPRT